MSPLAGWLGYFRWVGKRLQRREVRLISFQSRDQGILGVNGATAVYDLVMDGGGWGCGCGWGRGSDYIDKGPHGGETRRGKIKGFGGGSSHRLA